MTKTLVRPRMGTLLALTLSRRDVAHRRYESSVFDLARRYERIMSRHDPTSDLSRLNRSAESRAGIVAPDLARSLRAARRLSRRLDGAFDPTVGPVRELWRRRSIPTARSLRAAMSGVGVSAIRICGDRLALSPPRGAVDLDGFGKGWTLDRIAAQLRRRGCGSAFLNFGESSLVAIGRPPRGRWSVLLRHPFGGFVGEFTLEDRACSTSATFARPMRIGNRIVGDVIDPRRGRPVTRAAQVTVVASSAAAAEAISTALLVLGQEAVDDIARRMRVEVCWVDRSGIYMAPRPFVRGARGSR